MRQIKFRAWDGATNRMLETGFHVLGEVTAFGIIEQRLMEYPLGKTTLERIGDVVLMQFVGLKDRNGNDVYHKDYVLSGKKRFVVEWQQEEARFILLPCLGNTDNWKFMDEVQHMKVDGNIYESQFGTKEVSHA